MPSATKKELLSEVLWSVLTNLRMYFSKEQIEPLGSKAVFLPKSGPISKNDHDQFFCPHGGSRRVPGRPIMPTHRTKRSSAPDENPTVRFGFRALAGDTEQKKQ